MSKWSGSEYNGPKEHDWEQGEGKFQFPNGVIYHGNMDKGEFHGEGTLIYPNGVSKPKLKTFKIVRNSFLTLSVLSSQGRYVAKWDRGKLIEGKYFFYDALEF
jgi:hypothetical protein